MSSVCCTGETDTELDDPSMLEDPSEALTNDTGCKANQDCNRNNGHTNVHTNGHSHGHSVDQTMTHTSTAELAVHTPLPNELVSRPNAV